ncbi:hypothetical protein JJQ59_35930 (plasmid) [Cupriavidus necator]|nr:hypothetical protein [Cupriavidus necator]QQX89875.1 hypothetical protein JJQ59_35930 [Cupriavidus necator]
MLRLGEQVCAADCLAGRGAAGDGSGWASAGAVPAQSGAASSKVRQPKTR